MMSVTKYAVVECFVSVTQLLAIHMLHEGYQHTLHMNKSLFFRLYKVAGECGTLKSAYRKLSAVTTSLKNIFKIDGCHHTMQEAQDAVHWARSREFAQSFYEESDAWDSE